VFKVGLAGFGRLAQIYYVPALRTFDYVKVAAVADPLPDSAVAARESFPAAEVCSNFEDWRTGSLDALLVASPPSTHLAILSSALRQRIPVFIEKPVLLPGELNRLQISCETAGLIMPNFNRRFWPPYQTLRALCIERRLGKVQRAKFTLDIDIRPWLSITSHRTDDSEGGALCDLGSSQLDLIQYVLGQKIVSIRVNARSVRWLNDHVAIEAQLEDGFAVDCQLSYTERNREAITIVGEIATARIANPNCALHVETHRSIGSAVAGWTQDVIALGLKALMRDRSMLHYTIRASLGEFFDALSQQRPFSTSFVDAAENLAGLEAGTRSIKEKASVAVSPPGSFIHV
jgi:predicted dehydrogenase